MANEHEILLDPKLAVAAVVGVVACAGLIAAGTVIAAPFVGAYYARTDWSRGKKNAVPTEQLQAIDFLSEEAFNRMLTQALAAHEQKSVWASDRSKALISRLASDEPISQKRRAVLCYLANNENKGKKLFRALAVELAQANQHCAKQVSHGLSQRQRQAGELKDFIRYASTVDKAAIADKFMKPYLDGKQRLPAGEAWAQLANLYMSSRKHIVFDQLYKCYLTPQVIRGVPTHDGLGEYQRLMTAISDDIAVIRGRARFESPQTSALVASHPFWEQACGANDQALTAGRRLSI